MTLLVLDDIYTTLLSLYLPAWTEFNCTLAPIIVIRIIPATYAMKTGVTWTFLSSLNTNGGKPPAYSPIPWQMKTAPMNAVPMQRIRSSFPATIKKPSRQPRMMRIILIQAAQLIGAIRNATSIPQPKPATSLITLVGFTSRWMQQASIQPTTAQHTQTMIVGLVSWAYNPFTKLS